MPGIAKYARQPEVKPAPLQDLAEKRDSQLFGDPTQLHNISRVVGERVKRQIREPRHR